MNRVDIPKVVGFSWLFVPLNAVEGLMRFRGRSLPQRVRYQARLDEVHMAIWTSCVSV